jgi:acyl-CoA synthetase (AMP-forming)/AMP-acid ligase II
MNTADFLDIATAICPDRDSIVFEGGKRAYFQMCEQVNRLSNALIRLGVKKGDRVAILQVNCPEIVESYFATAKLGGIFVPLNFRAKTDELSYMLSNAEAKILFAGKRYLDMVRTMLPDLASIEKCICLDNKETDMLFYGDVVAGSPTDEVLFDIGDEDITILIYTAGTTGRPKGVPLRHDAFVSYVLGNVDPASPDIEEKNLLTVPLYHVAGIQGMLAAIYGGRTLVMMRQFEVREWLETVQRERATRAMLVPTMLKTIIDYPDFTKYDLSSLQVITYGAASMPFEVINKAIRVMPRVKFINAFGQTETASEITALGPEDHLIEGTAEERERKLKRLASSIGRPLPDVEVKILDEEGKELPRGQVGEIVAKGSRIMKGYWHDEQKTAQAFTPDGWLITGDRGWIDEEGYIFLAGRADDMIIRGGENISPEEVEDVLHSNPKVEEAAVIGVDDLEWGQEPRAIVVLKKGEVTTAGEIIEYCRSKLASFKRPKSVVFLDSLPHNPMGKVLRKALREQYGKP